MGPKKAPKKGPLLSVLLGADGPGPQSNKNFLRNNRNSTPMNQENTMAQNTQNTQSAHMITDTGLTINETVRRLYDGAVKG